MLSHGQVQLEPVCAESIEVYAVDGYFDSEYIWSVEGGEVIEGDGTDSVKIKWGYDVGRRFQIEVMERTKEGCTNVPSEATIEVRAPLVDLGYDAVEICENDSLVLDPGTGFEDPYTIYWNDSILAQEYIVKKSSQIVVNVVDGNGCYRKDTVLVTVNNLPEVNLGPDTILCDRNNPLYLDAIDFVSNPNEFNTATWEIDNSLEYTSFVSIYPNNLIDTLKLTVTNLNNCSNTDEMVLLPCDIAETIRKEMKNILSPNGDGTNDVWEIPRSEMFPNAVLEVFDRWGRLVYRSEKISESWDGTSKGRVLPMDAYYFVLELNFYDADPIVGTINIVL